MGKYGKLSVWTLTVIFVLVGIGSSRASFFDLTPNSNQVGDGNDNDIGFDVAGSASKHVDIDTPNILDKTDKIPPIPFKQPLPTSTTTTTPPPPPYYPPPPPPYRLPPPPHRPPPPHGKPCKRSADGGAPSDPTQQQQPNQGQGNTQAANNSDDKDSDDSDDDRRRAVSQLDTLEEDLRSFLKNNNLNLNLTKKDEDLLAQFKKHQQEKLSQKGARAMPDAGMGMQGGMSGGMGMHGGMMPGGMGGGHMMGTRSVPDQHTAPAAQHNATPNINDGHDIAARAMPEPGQEGGMGMGMPGGMGMQGGMGMGGGHMMGMRWAPEQIKNSTNATDQNQQHHIHARSAPSAANGSNNATAHHDESRPVRNPQNMMMPPSGNMPMPQPGMGMQGGMGQGRWPMPGMGMGGGPMMGSRSAPDQHTAPAIDLNASNTPNQTDGHDKAARAMPQPGMGMPGSMGMHGGMMSGGMGGGHMMKRSAPDQHTAPAAQANASNTPNQTDVHDVAARAMPGMGMPGGMGMHGGMGQGGMMPGGMGGGHMMGMRSAPDQHTAPAATLNSTNTPTDAHDKAARAMPMPDAGMGMQGGMSGGMGMHGGMMPGGMGGGHMMKRSAPDQHTAPAAQPNASNTPNQTDGHDVAARAMPGMMPGGMGMHGGMGGGGMMPGGMGGGHMMKRSAPDQHTAPATQPNASNIPNQTDGHDVAARAMPGMGMPGGMGMQGGMGQSGMMPGGMGGGHMMKRSAPDQHTAPAAKPNASNTPNQTDGHDVAARAMPGMMPGGMGMHGGMGGGGMMPGGMGGGHMMGMRSAPSAANATNNTTPDASAQHNLHTRSVPVAEHQPNATAHHDGPRPARHPQNNVVHPPSHHGEIPVQPEVMPQPGKIPVQPGNQHPDNDQDINKRAISPKFGGMMDRVMNYFN